MLIPANHCRARNTQHGYALLLVVVMFLLVAIFWLRAQPDWNVQMQRDREAELIYRGEHIAAAIRDFRAENNRSPTSLKELMEVGPRQHRYLRQLYTEPLNPSGEWDLIPVGDPSTLQPINPLLPGPGQTEAETDSFDNLSDAFLSFGDELEEKAGSGDDGKRKPFPPLKIGRCRGAGQAGGQAQGGIAGLPSSAIGEVIGKPIGEAIGSPIGTAGPGTQIAGVASLVDEMSIKSYQKKDRYCEWLFLANPPVQPGQPGQPQPPVTP